MAVLAKRFEGVVGKMQNTLLRTARSGVINTARDFSCCILTADADLLAAGESLPIHVMVGADMMARAMSEFHPELRRRDTAAPIAVGFRRGGRAVARVTSD